MAKGLSIPPPPDRERRLREQRNRAKWRGEVENRHVLRAQRRRARRQWTPPPPEWDEWEDDQ